MLTPDLIETLRAPVSEASPCGEDLAYDAAFIALEAAARGRPEQQFGDTVIAAVEPEWPLVADAAQALLRRSRDIRTAVLALRAATHEQDLQGFALGMQLLCALVDGFWAHLHPALDADDGDDPTMRLNALAALNDEMLLVRDLLDARIATAPNVGPLRVRDVAIARNALPAAGPGSGYTPGQVEGALREIAAEHPAAVAHMLAVGTAIGRLQGLLAAHSGRSDAVDLGRLRNIGEVLGQAARALGAEPPAADAAQPRPGQDAAASGMPAGDAPPAAARADLDSRQDALRMLDRVIDYLQRTEPGNPAPLLIARAKQLIGVSFLDIIANLAPDAMHTIEQVTGARADGEQDARHA